MKISFALKVMIPVLVTCTGLMGCAGYQVGTLLPERYKTISVPMFRNATTQPNIEALATNAVIEHLNVDGTLQVVERDPDLLLKCTISDYVRTPIRFADGIHPEEYRLTITVSATLRDVRDEKDIWANRLISGDTDCYVGPDLHSSERAAFTMLMEDLAHDIVEAVVEGW